jgi:hypothetical protein
MVREVVADAEAGVWNGSATGATAAAVEPQASCRTVAGTAEDGPQRFTSNCRVPTGASLSQTSTV